MDRYLWSGESPVQAWLCRSLLSLPTSHAVFPVNYPCSWGHEPRGSWHLHGLPETTLAAQRTEEPFCLPGCPEADVDSAAGGTGALPAQLRSPGSRGTSRAGAHWHLQRDPQHCLPAQTPTFRLGNLSSAVFHPCFVAAQPCARSGCIPVPAVPWRGDSATRFWRRKLWEEPGLGVGSFREQPGGGITAIVTPCPPWHGDRRSREEGDTEALWDGNPWEHPAEQRRAPCRDTPAGWGELPLAHGARQQLGLQAGLAGPREGQGPAEVMGSDGTRVGTSWAFPPVAEEGTWGRLWYPAPCPAGREGRQHRQQAGLSAGDARGLQGMGVPGTVHPQELGQSQVSAWPRVLHLPVLTWVQSLSSFPSSCGTLGNAPSKCLGCWVWSC